MSTQQQTKESLIHEDIQRLHGLGYAQELFREMGGFSNFAISFTIISILTGGVSTFGFGLLYGGTLAASVAWPVVSVFVTLVGLAMAELASAYPTAGGLYYWASKLGGPGWGWFTGWFNLIGQVGITASIDFGLAVLFDSWLAVKVPALATAVSNTNPIYILRWNVATYAVILIIHCLMNVYGIRLVALLNDISVWWHIVGVVIVVGALIFFAPHHSNTFAFLFSPSDSLGAVGITPQFAWYGLLLGLFLAQYTLTGYDASAHVAEETVGAARRAPWGIVMSIVVSAVVGYVLMLGMAIAIPDKAPASVGGSGLNYIALQGTNAVQTILSGLNTPWGGDAGFVIFGMILVAQFFCGMSSVTANSRMIYAFSRDGAVPGHELWHTLNRRRIPANAVWLAGAGAFVLSLPALFGNTVAFYALVSVGTVSIYIAYVMPTFTRLLSNDFHPGPWNLGRWSKPIGWIAVIWVLFISVLFLTPETFPITALNLNYAPVALGVCLVLLVIWWFASQRNSFKGPIVQGDEATLEKIEATVERESVYHEPGM
ncbi:MAG TPA: amino acid permease [Ktedonobacterales bacterium]